MMIYKSGGGHLGLGEGSDGLEDQEHRQTDKQTDRRKKGRTVRQEWKNVGWVVGKKQVGGSMYLPCR
jgi:hypothetical protein